MCSLHGLCWLPIVAYLYLYFYVQSMLVANITLPVFVLLCAVHAGCQHQPICIFMCSSCWLPITAYLYLYSYVQSMLLANITLPVFVRLCAVHAGCQSQPTCICTFMCSPCWLPIATLPVHVFVFFFIHACWFSITASLPVFVFLCAVHAGCQSQPPCIYIFTCSPCWLPIAAYLYFYIFMCSPCWLPIAAYLYYYYGQILFGVRQWLSEWWSLPQCWCGTDRGSAAGYRGSSRSLGRATTVSASLAQTTWNRLKANLRCKLIL